MTKTITLPVETYEKMKDYFSYCEDYTENMNDYLLDFKEQGCSAEQMSSYMSDYVFDDWFAENWENGLYEGWEEPVPTPEGMDRFINFLEETYTLVPTWKYIKSTNKLKFSVSRNVGTELYPDYQSVSLRASGGREKE